MSTTEQNETDARQKKSRQRKRRQRKSKLPREILDNSEDERIRRRFVKSSSGANRARKSDIADRFGPLLRRVDDDHLHLHNPSSHDRLIARARETQSNRSVAGSFGRPSAGDELVGAWRCALCQCRTGVSTLGDLFGPYYIRLDQHNWPSFVKRPMKTGKRASLGDHYTDVWLHGDCALWTPELQLKGAMLIGLQENVARYWMQRCEICSKEGATIACDDDDDKRFVHYPCAVHKGYILDRYTYTCRASASTSHHKK